MLNHLVKMHFNKNIELLLNLQNGDLVSLSMVLSLPRKFNK